MSWFIAVSFEVDFRRLVDTLMLLTGFGWSWLSYLLLYCLSHILHTIFQETSESVAPIPELIRVIVQLSNSQQIVSKYHCVEYKPDAVLSDQPEHPTHRVEPRIDHVDPDQPGVQALMYRVKHGCIDKLRKEGKYRHEDHGKDGTDEVPYDQKNGRLSELLGSFGVIGFHLFGKEVFLHFL